MKKEDKKKYDELSEDLKVYFNRWKLELLHILYYNEQKIKQKYQDKLTNTK